MCFACVSVSLCFLQLSEIYLYIFYFLCRMCFLKLCTWPKWSKCFVCPMCSRVKAIPCLCAFCVFCVISAFEIFFLPKEEIYVLFVPYVLLDQSSQVIMWLLCFFVSYVLLDNNHVWISKLINFLEVIQVPCVPYVPLNQGDHVIVWLCVFCILCAYAWMQPKTSVMFAFHNLYVLDVTYVLLLESSYHRCLWN